MYVVLAAATANDDCAHDGEFGQNSTLHCVVHGREDDYLASPLCHRAPRRVTGPSPILPQYLDELYCGSYRIWVGLEVIFACVADVLANHPTEWRAMAGLVLADICAMARYVLLEIAQSTVNLGMFEDFRALLKPQGQSCDDAGRVKCLFL